MNNYPDGEVFTSPVEDGINGEIYFDYPQNYRGNSAQGVHLWIENGKIVKAQAERGEEFLNAMINMDEGSHGIGEIAIGTNDEIQEITGNILFDEKLAVQSTWQWVLLTLKPEGKMYQDFTGT